MIIPARNIPKYMHSIVFPVTVLPEIGVEGARILGKREFWELIRANAIIAVGSWNRIRHFRLSRPLEFVDMRNVRLNVGAAANFTVAKEANVFRHRAEACAQFKKPGDPGISKSCL